MAKSDDDMCRTCKRTRGWHLENSPHHMFDPVGDGRLQGDSPNATVENVHTPFDPVLRLALINKGVLTPDDLSNAERIMKHVSGGSDGRTGSQDEGLPQG